MLFLDFGGPAAEFEIGPSDQVKQAFGRRNNVEWRGNCASILEVRDPQFASGKFPLYIGFFLHVQEHKVIRALLYNMHTIPKLQFCPKIP